MERYIPFDARVTRLLRMVSLVVGCLLCLVSTANATPLSFGTPFSQQLTPLAQSSSDTVLALKAPSTQFKTQAAPKGMLSHVSTLGVLVQMQSSADDLKVPFWIIGIPLLIADVTSIGGNLFSLFTGRNRFAWGVIGTVAGGLSMFWGFLPLFISDYGPVFSVTIWGIAGAALALGLVNMFFRSRRGFRRRRLRRRYRRRFDVLPWFNATRDGNKMGGLALHTRW